MKFSQLLRVYEICRLREDLVKKTSELYTIDWTEKPGTKDGSNYIADLNLSHPLKDHPINVGGNWDDTIKGYFNLERKNQYKEVAQATYNEANTEIQNSESNCIAKDAIEKFCSDNSFSGTNAHTDLCGEHFSLDTLEHWINH